MYTLVKTYGPLVSRQAKITGQDRLFATLCESVVSQQLAVKAADVIWGRLVVVSKGKVTPENILKTPLPRLRSAGLSGAKAKTLKALAKASKGGLHLPALRKKSQQEAEAILTEVWGIGPWTSEMFFIIHRVHFIYFKRVYDISQAHGFGAHLMASPASPPCQAILPDPCVPRRLGFSSWTLFN